jgi:hypothetical protein
VSQTFYQLGAGRTLRWFGPSDELARRYNAADMSPRPQPSVVVAPGLTTAKRDPRHCRLADKTLTGAMVWGYDRHEKTDVAEPARASVLVLDVEVGTAGRAALEAGTCTR